MADLTPDDGSADTSRRHRRVSWTPDTHAGDGFDTPPESDAPHVWGDPDEVAQEQSHDERLTNDKPPHWA
ncbi:MAG: hypothetical protein EBR52_04025 [Microbacteriaceae bacterium]|nr:hypothetical protein [Microbacteriaceae bacterium]